MTMLYLAQVFFKNSELSQNHKLANSCSPQDQLQLAFLIILYQTALHVRDG